MYDKDLNSSEDTAEFDDDFIVMDALLDEDTFMPTTTEWPSGSSLS